jgi:transglutaminase-like putative cysteine protease
MRYRVRHTTEYKYADRVSHCYNLANLTPRNTSRQRCIKSRIIVSPNAIHSNTRTDTLAMKVITLKFKRHTKNYRLLQKAKLR